MHQRRIGLVGCVKQKLVVPAAAGELYVSPLFVGRRRYVEASCDEWWILSAEHGLIHPQLRVAPYDTTLIGTRRATRQAWAARTLADIVRRITPTAADIIELHAGADYLDHGLADGLAHLGAKIVRPTHGMGIGRQLAFYAA